jgi:hypothetical protein
VRVEESVVSEIDVKEAVRLAKQFAERIYENEKISQLGLEAIERTEDGKHWRVTLGFARPWAPPKPARKREVFKTPLEQALSGSRESREREYKVFRVDAQSGDVVSMEMFE